MNYDFYLFSRLAVDMELIDSELEYDLAFEDALELFNEFEESSFNDGNKNLYDCIVDYIKFKTFKIN
jgi:hypothetical protein